MAAEARGFVVLHRLLRLVGAQLSWSAHLCLPTNQALRGTQQHLIAYSQALGRSERRRCLALRTNTLGAPRLGAFSFASLPTNQALAASRAGVRCE